MTPAARKSAVIRASGLDRAILVARAVFWTEKLILTPLYYNPSIGLEGCLTWRTPHLHSQHAGHSGSP